MLRGKSVSLGPVIPADFPALFRWGNDLDAARLNEAYRPADWNSHQEWWSNIGKDPSKVVFAIRKYDSTNIVGYVQILNINGTHRSADIGVRIGEEADRGHGYGSEAMALAVDYCWKHLNISRVGLSVFRTNDRAIKLYAGLGFEAEGVLRRAVFIDGQWVDVVLMAILHPSRVNERQPAAARPSDAVGQPQGRREDLPGEPPAAEKPPAAVPRAMDGAGRQPARREDPARTVAGTERQPTAFQRAFDGVGPQPGPDGLEDPLNLPLGVIERQTPAVPRPLDGSGRQGGRREDRPPIERPLPLAGTQRSDRGPSSRDGSQSGPASPPNPRRPW